MQYNPYDMPLILCHLPFAIRHLPSAIRHPPSAIRHPPSAIRHPPSAICHPPFFDSALNVTPLTMLNRANLLAEKAMVLSKAGRREEAVACAEQTEEFLKPIETNGDNESVTKFIGWLGHGGGLLSRFVDPLGSVEWQSLAAVALNLDEDRRV